MSKLLLICLIPMIGFSQRKDTIILSEITSVGKSITNNLPSFYNMEIEGDGELKIYIFSLGQYSYLETYSYSNDSIKQERYKVNYSKMTIELISTIKKRCKRKATIQEGFYQFYDMKRSYCCEKEILVYKKGRLVTRIMLDEMPFYNSNLPYAMELEPILFYVKLFIKEWCIR